MNFFLFVLLSVFNLSGCNAFDKLHQGGGIETPQQVIVIDGFAKTDYDSIPLDSKNRDVLVQIGKGPAPWRKWEVLNEFEYDVLEDRVNFKRVAYPVYNDSGTLVQLAITSRPSVPKGTFYRITAVLKKGNI